MSSTKLINKICIPLSLIGDIQGNTIDGPGLSPFFKFYPAFTIWLTRFSLAVLLLLAAIADGRAQSKLGFEQYNYIRQPDAAVFVPMVHFETNKNWYAELRYNYEDVRTLSLFAGKTFTGGKAVEYTLTPMAGYSIGRFTGWSVAANTEAEWNNFYVWAQSQYSIGARKNIPNFFFNWSELGYNISDHVFAGLAMQYTSQEGEHYFEPGFVAGVSWKNVSFPLYVFSPFRPGCYFIVGLNYEYSLKKKNKQKN